MLGSEKTGGERRSKLIFATLKRHASCLAKFRIANNQTRWGLQSVGDYLRFELTAGGWFNKLEARGAGRSSIMHVDSCVRFDLRAAANW